MVTPTIVIVEQRAMDAERIAFQDRAVPTRRQHCAGSFLAKPVEQVFGQFDIPFIRKVFVDFLFRRLEKADGRIHCAIDDLNVLHDDVLASASAGGNRRRLTRDRRADQVAPGSRLEPGRSHPSSSEGLVADRTSEAPPLGTGTNSTPPSSPACAPMPDADSAASAATESGSAIIFSSTK